MMATGPALRTIYLLEDDDSVRRALTRLLRSAGFECMAFATGEELLARVSPGTRGCLILDLQMPGLVGHDVQRRLNEAGVGIPVIALSAQDDDATRQRSRELGASAFFRKPVDDQALLDAIYWALDGPPPGSG